jgi:hypothetical protein
MKHVLFSLFILVSIGTYAQVYDPSKHIPVNKALGVAQAAPTDARSMFYDADNFVYRPYQSTAEVLSYLSLSKYRVGAFDILVNSGGTLLNGVITGGTNTIYCFKDGTADGNLVVKTTAEGGGTLTNIGSGFRVAQNGTANVKTLYGGYGVTLDSTSNSNAITAKLDTATLFGDLPVDDTFYISPKWFGATGNGVISETVSYILLGFIK